MHVTYPKFAFQQSHTTDILTFLPLLLFNVRFYLGKYNFNA